MMRGLVRQEEYDEVVINCIRVMSGNPALLKEAESLIKLINSDWQKVSKGVLIILPFPCVDSCSFPHV